MAGEMATLTGIIRTAVITMARTGTTINTNINITTGMIDSQATATPNITIITHLRDEFTPIIIATLVSTM
jgi:hypothetical protein